MLYYHVSLQLTVDLQNQMPTSYFQVMIDFLDLQTFVHYGMHLAIPGLIAWLLFRSNWKNAYVLLVLTMLVDVDHLLADPLFDPNRCSINFHPLHTYYAMLIYTLGLWFHKTRIVSVGLLFHMLTDWIDCQWMGL